MISVIDRLRSIDVPYMIRLYRVTDEMFDELVDEDTKAELLDGVMIVHSPASIEHDDVTAFLRTLMRLYANRKKLGKVLGPDSLVHLATCRRFGPDAYFVESSRVPGRREKQFEGVPDLVLEVLSPSNRTFDLEDKRPAYREAGVKEIWLVDPEEKEVIVDRKRGKRYTEQVVNEGKVSSTVLAGFWIDVAWLWADPLPDEDNCLAEILSSS